MSEEILARTLLLGSYSNPPKPTFEELFIAYLINKQLCDLCETGVAIIDDLPSSAAANMPDKDTLKMIRRVLSKWYSEEMFIESAKYGVIPDWPSVKSFASIQENPAWILYLVIRAGVKTEMVEAMKRKDKKYFIRNFDDIFGNLPSMLKESLGKFKNFIQSNELSTDDQEIIWEYFEQLLNTIVDRDATIQRLQKTK